MNALAPGTVLREVFDVTVADEYGATAVKEVVVTIDGPTSPTVDAAPVLSNVAASASYTEQGAATTLSSGTVVSDADNATLASATVSISSGFLAGDTLTAATAGTTITASYDGATGVLLLSGSDTLAHYQAVLDSVTYASSSQNPTNFGADTSRTISWVVNDGTLSSAAQTTTVAITAVDAAPVLSNVAASASYTEQGAATTLSSGTVVSDADNATLASATVSISSGFLAGDTLTAATAGTTITASYDGATGVLLLSGSDTLAHYQAVLDSVTYASSSQNPTNFGADTSRTISWVVNDGTLSSAAQTTTVAITAVDAAPVLSNVAASASYTEQGAATTLSSGTVVSDADNATLASATVSISSGFLAGDTLTAATAGTTITASYDGATGVLLLSGSDTLAHYQAVLDSVTYASSSQNPTNFGADTSRTISWVVNDGTLSSAAQTTTVAITAVDAAPVLSNVAASASYTEQGAATTLSSGTVVSDADNATLASATVSISSGFLAGDTLTAATAGTTITASYDGATGVLLLSGSDTLAHYQAVLDSVTYASSSQNPTNFGADTSRTISWVVNDGTLSSAAQTTTVAITAVDAAPVLSNVAASASYTEQGAATTLSSGTVVSDADNATLASATVSISSGFLAGDTLTAATAGTTITASYDGATGVLLLSGSDTLAHYQAVLDSVTYASSSQNPTNFGADTSRTISWVVNDGTLSSAAQTTTVAITAVDAAPVLSNVAASASYTEQGAATTLSSGTVVSDADNATLASATVSISSGFLAGDTLTAATAGTTITASYDGATGVLLLSGSDTLAHYQAVLDSVTYASSSQNPTNFGADTSRTISWVVNDGTLSSAAQTTTVAITAVDAAPVLSNVAASASYTEQGAATTLSSGTVVSDADNATLASATVSISSGFLAGDTLTAATAGTTITASYDGATGVLLLSGSDTLAHYQAVLDSVTYASSSQNPTNFGADTSRTISWVVNDGTLSSAAQTTTVAITAVDAAPVLSNVAASASYTEQGAATTLSSGTVVSDADNATLASATVSISSGFLAGDTLTAATAGTTITASYDGATGVLLLSGSDTLAHYQAVLDSVTYASSSQNPTNFGADTSRTISWVVNDGTLSSAAQTTTVAITAVDAAPVLSNVAASASYTEQGAATTLSSGTVVSDADNATLASATVSISSGFLAGDTLTAATAGTTITASYDGATGVLLLSGSDTLAHYQAVLDSVTYASSSQNPTNFGADTSRTISWVVNDGTLSSAAQTTTVAITAVDAAPVLSNVAASASYTEQGAATTLSSGTVVSDADNATLASATVSISSGFLAGDTLTAATAGTTITASYDGATGVLLLSGSDTLAHYQAVLDSVTYASSSQNPTNFGADTSRTISWVVNDGTLSSAAQTTTVAITAVDAAPVLSNVAASASYTEQGAATTLSSGTVVSDADNATLASATVSISSGFLAGDTLTAATAGTTITASYDGATGVLLLSGSDTLAHYQAVLDSVTYASSSQNPTNFGADTSRTISWVVNDGTLSSAAQTTTVAITAVDAAPVLSNVAASASYTEQGAATTLSSGTVVSDADNATLASATVSISSGFLAGDTLTAATAGTTITASYDGATGVLLLSGSDTLAHYQAVLDSVTYASSSQNPTNFGADTSRTISWVVNDGTLSSAAQTTTVAITAVDAAPVLSNVAASASYTEQGAATTLSSGTVVSDADNATLASATVSISSGFLAGDTLTAATAGTTITASYDGATGVLLLSGSDTLAHYQAVLDSVTYASSSQNPTNFGADTSRTISWVVNDGTLSSAAQTTTVAITAVDAAPVLSNVAASASYTEQGAATTLSSGTVVSDADNATLASATVSISSGFLAGDTLTAATAGTTITASYDGATGVLLLSGSDTLAHYQAVLDSVTYASSSQNPTNFGADTSRTISWVVNDGTLSSAAQTTTVAITAVDAAPVLSNVAASASYTEQGAATTLSSGTVVSDADNATLASATVSISSGFLAGDTLTAATAGTTITASYDGATGVLLLSGSDTLAHYQAVLDSVTYASSSQNPTNFGADTSRTISWVVNDGTLSSAAQTTTVAITAVDAAPVLSNVAASASYTEQGAATTLSSGTVVSDADNATLASATVSISSGFLAGDTLTAATAGTTITASYDGATGVLLLSGSDTLAHYQAVLDSVTYASSSQNPTNFGADTSRTISWVVNDGTLSSAAQTTTVAITAVDAAPVLSNVAASASYTEQGAATTLSSGTVVSDADNATLASATVSISSGFLAGDTLTAATAGTTITASYDGATGVLLLSGSDTLAHYQAVLDSVTYASSSQNPTNFGADTSRTISWVVNDGTLSSAAQTTTVAITAVDAAPVLSNVAASASYTEQGAATTLSSGTVVSDADNATLASATVSISSGFLAGDTLTAATAGTTITASYDGATGVLLLSGSDTLAHYQAVLDSVTYASSSQNPTNFGADTSRTISWVVNDGTLSSAAQTTTVAITAVDAAPVLSNVAASASYTEQGAATTLSSGTVVSDADNATLASATVSISSGFLAGDTLTAATAGTTITASYDGATGVLLLSGSDTLAHYQAVLDSVTYASSSQNPTNFGADTSRTISWVVNDGTLSSAAQTTTVAITAVDAAPVLSNVAASASYTEQGAATTLSSGTVVSDADNATLASATVSISSGFLAGDTLTAATAGTTITASYDGATGVLLLSGSDTLAHYQAVLDSVTYASSSQNPTNFGADTSRTISWVVNDGTLSSAAQTTTVAITAVDAAPVLSNVAASASYTEQGAATTLSSGTVVSDADNATLASATVSISSGFLAGDTLTAATAGTTITASYDGATGVLLLSGSDTLAHYQAVLDSVTYASSSQNPTNFGADTSRTISWVVNDGTLSSAAQTTTVAITAVDAAPVLSNVAASASYTEQGAATTLSSGTVVSDADNATLASATVSISSGFLAGDTLTAATAGTTITASYDGATGVLLLSGSDTLAHYQAVLDSVTYASSSQNPTNFGADTSRTISWVVNDGTLSSAAQTTTVAITAVDAAPVLSNVAASASYTEQGAATTLSSGTVVSDADNATLASATVSISGGFLAGDTLTAATAGTTITASYDGATGVLLLSGSDTLAHYQAVLDSVTYASSSQNPTNFGADTSRTISWVVNDGTLSSAAQTTTVAITAVDAAPVLSNVAASASYTEQGAATTLSSGTVVSDADNATLASATVSISSGFLAGDTLTAATAGTTITASYDGATGVLLLSGSDTLAHYQAVLDSVTYASSSQNPTNFGADTSRTISWVVNDGTLSSAAQTTTVAITAVDAAPVLSNVAASASYTEQGAATTLSSGTVVSDADNATLASATVSISGGFLAGDTLTAATAGTTITASYDGATGVLLLSGSDTLAHYQSVLDSVTYGSSSQNPTNFGADTSRTISWVVNDGTLSSAAQTTTVAITAVDAAPVLSNVAASASYTEQGAATTLSSGTVVSDADNATLASATVSISGGFLAGDTLTAATAGTTITASYDGATGVLLLSGSDTLAHYQSVLDSVTYASSSQNPTNFGADTSRTISWVVNDGTLSSAAQTTTVAITAVDAAPVLSNVAASASYTEQGAATTLSSGTVVSDADNATLASATVSISGGFLAGDTLTAATAGTTITASYDGATGVLLLSGSDTLAHYQAVLDSVTYASSSQNPTNFGADTSRTISWVVNDGTLSSAAQTTTVAITAVDAAPVLSNVAASASYTEQGAATTLSSGTVVSDADNATLASATVSISSGFLAGDTLTAATAGTTITASYDGATGVLLLSGSDTLAHYQSVLDSVTYASSSQNPTNFGADTSRTISWVVNDGTLSSAAQTTTVAITAVDAAPVLSNVAASASYTEQGAATTLSSGTVVSDADNATLASATVSISSGFLAGDTLTAATAGTTITASYDGATGVLLLSGSDTLAHYQSVLDSVTYASSSQNPTNFGADTSRTISWVVNDGTLSSAAQTTTVAITAVDAAPVLSNVAASASYTEQGAATTLSSGTVVSDADNATLASATVSISGGFLAGDTLTAATAGTTITASYDGATGVLLLSGSDTLAHYQSVLDSVTYASSSQNPTNFGADTSRTISWVVNDGTLSSAAQTTTVAITAVDAAPVLSNVAASASYTEQGAATTLSSGTVVSDADNATLASATVSISGGFLAGDTLTAATAGTTITASYDGATGVLLLSGSDTLAHYQSVLDSVTYGSSSQNPTNFGADTSRTISWVVNDGTLSSAAQTTTVAITAVDAAPVLSNVAASASYTEQGAATTLSSGTVVSDADNATLASATVSISGGFLAGDTLTAATAGTTITASYDGATGVLLLSGSDTLAHYQSVLDSVTYASSSQNPTNFGADTSRTISWVVNDGTLSSAAQTTTVAITAVDAAPVLSNVAASASYTEQGAATTLSSGTVVSDADNATLASATVSISSGFLAGDTLTAATAGTTITASYDGATGVLLLSGSDTLAHYQAVLDSVTYGSSSQNPTNFGADTSRTISWVVNDGTLSSAAQTTTVAITAVDAAPVLSNVAASASYTEQGAATTLSSGTVVSDADNATLASATVSISSGFLAGDTLTAATAGTTITASYDGATGVLLLSGSDTLAHYQSVLDSVTYASSSQNPTNFGADTSRTISWVVNDGTLSSAAQTTTVAITAVDAAPVLSNVAASASYTEQGAATTLSSGTVVSDADNATLASATVSISSGFLAGDTLTAATAGTTITASYDGATGVLLLSGSDTLAHYQAVLDSVTYASSSQNPTNFGADTSRTISWVVNDGTLSSAAQTTTVAITAVDAAPVLSNVAASASYTEQGAATTLSSGTVVSDADNATLASATVSISSGFLAGDTLTAATAGTTITASYDGATGVLLLSGSDTLAHYQAVLDSVTYASSSQNPTNFGADTSRTISWVVNDGTLSSAAQTTTVAITAVDAAPVLSNVAASASYTEQGAATTLSSGTVVSDADNATLASATVSISSGFLAGDTLTAATAGTTITASYDGATGVLLLSGSDTLAHYQAVLDSVTYASSSQNPTNFGADTSRTISWVVNDGTLSSAAQTTTVAITAVDAAPVLSNVAASASYTEQGAATTLSSGTVVSDADNATLASATVSISSGFLAGDTLTAATAGTTITASYDGATGVLLLSGSDTLAHYQAVLDSVTYASSSQNPTNFGADTSRTISWVVNDGTLSSAAQTTTVAITAVDAAPVLSNVAASASYTEQGAATTLSSGTVVSDADNATLASATVSISSGFLAGDTLTAATAGTTITASYDGATGVLLLSGSDTLAHYQAVLDSVTYASSSQNPTNFGADTSRTISWVVNDGTLSSAAQTTTVAITASYSA